MVNVNELATGFITGGIAGAATAALNSKEPTVTLPQKNAQSKSTKAGKPTTSDTFSPLTEHFAKKSSNPSDEDIAAAVGIVTGVGIFIMILIFVGIILSIVFLVAIYKMMPSYKVLHVIMSLLLGAFWYMPALIHYCVTNSYVLTTPGVGLNSGAGNNRLMGANARNARNARAMNL